MTPEEHIEHLIKAGRKAGLTEEQARRHAELVVPELHGQQSRYADTARWQDRICGIISHSGPNGEPLACAYLEGHAGAHSWATLPTFVAGQGGSGE